MGKPCIRFAKLVMGFLEETQMTPVEFGEFLRDWREDEGTIAEILGGTATMAMLLGMIFTTRHQLKKEMLDPEFNSKAFFLEYQLNLPLDDLMNPFAGLFRDLPKEMYKELAVASVDLSQMFIPQPSPWTQPGLFGTNRVELSHEPLPKPKPLPKPTHKAPSTLQ